MILFELLNYFLGMICFAGSILAFILSGFCFKEKDFILGVIAGIFGVVLFSLFYIVFFTF